MDQVNSQRQQDELPASVELVASAATDEVLVAAAKLRDHHAFVELWTRHSRKTFNVAYRVTGNQDDAEDAIQDAWMKAYMHLDTFDGRAKFSTWLTRIAINSSLMILRRKRARSETSMEIKDGDTGQHWEIADGRLHPTLRNVVEIRQSNDHSVKEVAELAGISVAATKSRLLRARKILREVFD
jgi:RNA polymerase sigma-70 factor, ECF subfamily